MKNNCSNRCKSVMPIDDDDCALYSDINCNNINNIFKLKCPNKCKNK
jgi:hypothetical protein